MGSRQWTLTSHVRAEIPDVEIQGIRDLGWSGEAILGLDAGDDDDVMDLVIGAPSGQDAEPGRVYLFYGAQSP